MWKFVDNSARNWPRQEKLLILNHLLRCDRTRHKAISRYYPFKRTASLVHTVLHTDVRAQIDERSRHSWVFSLSLMILEQRRMCATESSREKEDFPQVGHTYSKDSPSTRRGLFFTSFSSSVSGYPFSGLLVREAANIYEYCKNILQGEIERFHLDKNIARDFRGASIADPILFFSYQNPDARW